MDGVITITVPNCDMEQYDNVCKGVMISKPNGENSSSYNPIFLFTEFCRTMAELSDVEKNAVSHCEIAVRKAACALRTRGDDPSWTLANLLAGR